MSAPSAAGPDPTAGRSHRNRNLLIVAVAIVAIAAVAAGGYGLWYILIGPSSPAAVSSAPPAIPSGAAVGAASSMDGTWNVNTSLGSIDDATATFAGYRVDNVQITADLTHLVSDDSHRDDQLRRQALQTDNFPTAMFKTIQPIDLGTLPADGTSVSVNATGALSIHGVTRTVTIALQAVRQGGLIAVTGTLPINFSDYSMQKPNSFSVLSVDDHGTMELHLLFTHA